MCEGSISFEILMTDRQTNRMVTTVMPALMVKHIADDL